MCAAPSAERTTQSSPLTLLETFTLTLSRYHDPAAFYADL